NVRANSTLTYQTSIDYTFAFDYWVSSTQLDSSVSTAWTINAVQTLSGDIDLTAYIPDMLISDFVSGILKEFNLTCYGLSPTIFQVEPIEDWYVKGRLIDVTKQHQFQLQMLELIGSDRLSELIVLEDHFDSVFEVFNEVEKNYQRIITQRLRITMNGMIKYAKRKSNSSVMIESRAMLDEYIFFVAGNVGYLIYDILSEKKIFDKKDPRIKPLCLNLGQSLQLTNILIDKNEDAQHGRYWFPGSSSLGQRSIALYANEVSEKIHQCIYFFQSLNYPHKGIKFFIIFPAYLALATMQKIILNPHFRSKNEIKLTRSEIYKLYFKLLFVKL
ncbi:MAG: hypothetical protein EBY41_05375, partial [Proteobacteria bacterium]|nr:hypothetical protein [Pseudomonadota bacterium]